MKKTAFIFFFNEERNIFLTFNLFSFRKGFSYFSKWQC